MAFAPETIVHEINAILLCFERNAVHKGALASIAAVSAREMKADVGVGARDGLAGVERNTAARGGGFSILEVAIAPVLPDKFTVPNVVPDRASENAAGRFRPNAAGNRMHARRALVAALRCLELLAGSGVLDLTPSSLLHVHGWRRPRSKAFVLAE